MKYYTFSLLICIFMSSHVYACEVNKTKDYSFEYKIEKNIFEYIIKKNDGKNIYYIIKNDKFFDNNIGFYINDDNHLYSNNIFLTKKIIEDIDINRKLIVNEITVNKKINIDNLINKFRNVIKNKKNINIIVLEINLFLDPALKSCVNFKTEKIQYKFTNQFLYNLKNDFNNFFYLWREP